MTKHIIAWDLGATKCTAGIIDYDEETKDLHCKKHVTLKLANATSLENLTTKIEDHLNMQHSSADAVCIGAAGFYDGETLLHENNYPYPMHFAQLAKHKAWPTYNIIHDYAPIVCATFTNYMNVPGNIKHLNKNPMQPLGRRVALGLGTGLGMKDGVLLPNGDFWLGQNEIGHIGITTPPMADRTHRQRHEELIRYLQSQMALSSDQLTFEKILTGQGTVHLYQFFYPDRSETTPEQVGIKMREGKASEMQQAFAWYTGLFIGTVQLTFMPEGGIWITGGVALNHLDVFDDPSFFAGIKASPAYRSQREAYPLGVLCNHEHALIGCGYFASKRLLS